MPFSRKQERLLHAKGIPHRHDLSGLSLQQINKRIEGVKQDKRFDVKIHHENPDDYDKELKELLKYKNKLRG